MSNDQWDSDDESWDSDTSEWGSVDGKPLEQRLIIADTTGRVFLGSGLDTTDNGTAFRSYVERIGIDGGDIGVYKHVYRITPAIDGSGTVTIYAGGAQTPNGGYTW